MRTKHKLGILGATAVAALAAGGVAIAGGSGDDDASDIPITGAALDRARGAALDHTGTGRVTATEAGDEDGAYEVEVTRPDGSQVDVHLDKGFNVIGTEDDGKGDREDERGGG